MKKILVITWLILLLGAIGALFWYNELQYQLPTPIPQNYKAVNPGELIKLNAKLKTNATKPLFLHFFNPVCPCSRFNIKMFKSLVAQYGQKVNFVIVVISDRPYTAKEIQDKFDLNIPVTFDQSIALARGVYSTPQVALIDNKGKLYNLVITTSAVIVPTKKQIMRNRQSTGCLIITKDCFSASWR